MNHELTPEDAALISSATADKVKRETGHTGVEFATVVSMSQSEGNVPYVVISLAAGKPGQTLTVPSRTGQIYYPGQRVSIEWDPPAGCYVTGTADLEAVPRVRASLLCGDDELTWTFTGLGPVTPSDLVEWSTGEQCLAGTWRVLNFTVEIDVPLEDAQDFVLTLGAFNSFVISLDAGQTTGSTFVGGDWDLSLYCPTMYISAPIYMTGSVVMRLGFEGERVSESFPLELL